MFAILKHLIDANCIHVSMHCKNQLVETTQIFGGFYL